jgi:hypothetical protein
MQHHYKASVTKQENHKVDYSSLSRTINLSADLIKILNTLTHYWVSFELHLHNDKQQRWLIWCMLFIEVALSNTQSTPYLYELLNFI